MLFPDSQAWVRRSVPCPAREIEGGEGWASRLPPHRHRPRSAGSLLGRRLPPHDQVDECELVELDLAPRVLVTARFAYVSLKGRTEAPVMRLFRGFVNERLREV